MRNDKNDPGLVPSPHGKSHNRERNQAQSGLTNERQRDLKVLIVEDERLIAENLKLIIEEDGYQPVAIASSAEEAISEAERTQPELILMDIRIRGELDGVHAAKLIQDRSTKKIYVLFISAYSQDQFPHLSNLNPDSYFYLQKPYGPEDLTAAMQILLSRPQNR